MRRDWTRLQHGTGLQNSGRQVTKLQSPNGPPLAMTWDARQPLARMGAAQLTNALQASSCTPCLRACTVACLAAALGSVLSVASCHGLGGLRLWAVRRHAHCRALQSTLNITMGQVGPQLHGP